MSSQKDRGYLLPEVISDHDLICVQLKIPNALEYRAALRQQLYNLGKWTSWDRTRGDETLEAATLWRTVLSEHLVFSTTEDCVSAIVPEFRFTEECMLEYSITIPSSWMPVPGWGEFALLCFQGADGTPGTDGTDGVDFVPTPFSLIGSAEGNVLLYDLIGGLISAELVTDFGVVLGEHVPPVLPCELDNCQIANVTLQWIATVYYPQIMYQMGQFVGGTLEARYQNVLNAMDIKLLNYDTFLQFCTDIFDVFSVIDDEGASLDAFVTYGSNYIVNDLPNVLVCRLSDCGYMSIDDWAIFIADLPDDEFFKTIVNDMLSSFGELAFAAITTMAKNSRLVDSFMIPCDPCDDSLCVIYDFTTTAYDTDWNITDGTWIDGFGYSPPSGDDAIRVNMGFTPDLEMTYIRVAGTNPSEVDAVIQHVDVNSGRVIDSSSSPTTTPWFSSVNFDPDEVTNLIEVEIICDGENPAFLTTVEIHYRVTGGAPTGGNSC